MHLRRKRISYPLPEEYTRVTNPERFRGLQNFAVDLLTRLRNDYDVMQSEEFEMTPDIMRPVEHSRPPVTLTPVRPGAATISIAFTSFPSLIVRCGHLFNEPFPVCACDACHATAENESERLEGVLVNVVSGRFCEEIELPFFGTPKAKWRLGTMKGRHGLSEGGNPLSRDRARAAGFKRIDWKPWLRR